VRLPIGCAALLGLGLGVWLVACGGGRATKASTAPAAPAASEATAPTGRPTDEIDALDQQIELDLARLGLEPPSDVEIVQMMTSSSTPALPDAALASTCGTAPTGDTCSDVCALGDSICGNARRICDLAAQLAGDDHAAQRCAGGKASCDRARTRCCACGR